MTSENPDLARALEVVNTLLKAATDPGFRRQLEALKTAAKKPTEVVYVSSDKKPAEKGTCPTCWRTYTLRKNGTVRRHGKDVCYNTAQLPAEIIPAIFAIAQLGESRKDGTWQAGRHT